MLPPVSLGNAPRRGRRPSPVPSAPSRATGRSTERALVRFVACAVALVLTVGVAAASPDDVAYRRATVSGISVFYREAGLRTNPTILLLHGFPSSSHMFRDLIPRLAGRFHVLAPDYPGMGSSEAPPADRFRGTFDAVTDVTEGLLRQLGEDRIVIYMQDFGGPVGMRLATRDPERVAGLVFQNTPVSLDGWDPDRLKAVQANVGPETPDRRRSAEGRVSLATALFLYRHGARNPSGLNPDAWVSDDFAIERYENRRIMTDLQLDIPTNLALYPGWQGWLKAHRPRTLVVWGTNDPIFTPAGAEAVRALVPGTEVHFYDTGHFALEEDAPSIAAEIISTFATPKP